MSHCNFNLSRINRRSINDSITIKGVIKKNMPQSPFNQSTIAPDDAVNVVIHAVPIDASKAYCVAV